MEKHISVTNFRTLDGEKVEPANSYIYEITYYRFYKNEARIELEQSKFIKADKYIKFKLRKIIYPEYIQYVEVFLIAAPKEFLENLQLFELTTKIKKNEKGKKGFHRRQVRRQ